jgi:hypothetical protein
MPSGQKEAANVIAASHKSDSAAQPSGWPTPPRGCSAIAMKVLALHGNGYVLSRHSIARAVQARA